ncbi:hypothetical protein [Schinkia azotoformans]|uniref:hypothetical protein n=1 Tax=Schinkia azotoformans TaxID=1454 RepID=UPI002DB8506C|nr:hypothetical protein [Schinkia azotoformans]MEC1714739.1 hypothetical protein [Schinkia azotoformans]MEC1757505.1 hypothetical protein [Schinkia azotoformans]
MNDPDVFSAPCAICKVRKATRLCDYVIDYDRSIIFFRDYKAFKEANENTRYETCDLPLCDECSHCVNDVDFCPHHLSLHKQVELPEHLQQAQSRSKINIYFGR